MDKPPQVERDGHRVGGPRLREHRRGSVQGRLRRGASLTGVRGVTLLTGVSRAPGAGETVAGLLMFF